jgi:hypothetical protein
MITPKTVSVLSVLSILATTLIFSKPALASSNRWAIVAGNNFGGEQEDRLKYAQDDAERVAQVLQQLGSFPADQVEILNGGTPAEFLDKINNTSKKIQQNNHPDSSLLVVFYSGHADGSSLLMGRKKLGIAELKKAVNSSSADIALIILDACHSGSAVRIKGGRSAPSFLRFSDPLRAKGRIILTSALDGELAQESDDIGSSVFTHFLVSGLMGDADRSGDRRVTLNELYRYVYDWTVQKTFNTMPGSQHPAFLYDIQGEGSIVLTDINNESSGIFFSNTTSGNYIIFDKRRRTVVAEIKKTKGDQRLVPLTPGTYTIKKRNRDHLLVADLGIRKDQVIKIADNKMKAVNFESRTNKGWDLYLKYRPSRWEIQSAYNLTAFTTNAPKKGVWNLHSIGVAVRRQDWPARQWATQASFHFSPPSTYSFPDDNPVGGRSNFDLFMVGLDFSMGRTLEYGPLMTELGGRFKSIYFERKHHDLYVQEDTYDPALGPGLGGYLQGSIGWGPFRVVIDFFAGSFFFFQDDAEDFVPVVSGGLSFAFGW